MNGPNIQIDDKNNVLNCFHIFWSMCKCLGILVPFLLCFYFIFIWPIYHIFNVSCESVCEQHEECIIACKESDKLPINFEVEGRFESYNDKKQSYYEAEAEKYRHERMIKEADCMLYGICDNT